MICNIANLFQVEEGSTQHKQTQTLGEGPLRQFVKGVLLIAYGETVQGTDEARVNVVNPG